MAIVKMSKIRLVGLEYHKEKLLNALHKTGCVELRATSDILNTEQHLDQNKEQLVYKYNRYKECVELLTEKLSSKKGNKIPLSNIFVSYEEFCKAKEKEEKLGKIILELFDCKDKLTDNRSEKIKLSNLRLQLLQYVGIKEKFSEFNDTKNTKCFLGAIKQESIQELKAFFDGIELCHFEVLINKQTSIIFAIAMNSDAELVNDKLSSLGYTACNFKFDLNAESKIKEIDSSLKQLDEDDKKVVDKICELGNNLNDIKLICDYYRFEVEKANDSENFRCTNKTFVLEGFLPQEREGFVKESLLGVSNAIYIEYLEPSKDEVVPTLVKNNKVIRQTEFVTDMYSAPNYREIDPNKVVFFFFMLFMGIIMADIGYGLIMIILGTILAKRIKVDCGTRRLWYVISIGGVFAIIFGILFNSLFGISVLPFNILPSPTPDAKTGAINLETIMTLLLACLGLGVFQIAVGYLCKAINCFKNGRVIDGILDGLVWVLFFVGLIFATFNFLMDYLKVGISPSLRAFFDKLTLPGLIIVGTTVLISALTAGRYEKGFGKFTKGFGAVYGLISIMSDILSYARLFGLMLSGMIIAQTFNYKLGLPMINGGGVGVILGPLVIVIGHVFNLAMNVLGAYIHDSRLQYIEFFSKFYTGEGEMFRPLGSKFDYIYLTN